MYDLLLTEGDLRRILAGIEQRRSASDQAYCLQIHIEPGQDSQHCLQAAKATIEVLRTEMITEMRAKGQIDFEASE